MNTVTFADLNLDTLSIDQLRKIARQAGHKGGWINRLSKQELTYLIVGKS